MSLTEAERVFAGITETGINDVLRAVFNARPRYLRYGSPGFVPVTTTSATSMPAIQFPGVPGGIDWAVGLEIPRVDLHPQTEGLPPELTLGAQQLSVRTVVTLCVACEGRRQSRPDDDRPDDDRPDDDREREQRDTHRHPKDDLLPIRGDASCFEVRVFAVGRLQRTFAPDGVVVVIDALEIVDIEPTELESVIECLLLQVLRAVMANVRLPLQTLRAGAFSLALTRGPEVENDQLEVYGSL